MDEFFRSIGKQFAQQRSHEGRAGAIAAVGIALLILAWLVSQLVRLWRARQALLDFAARHLIGRDELALAVAIARLEKRAPLELLEQVDQFELATARALAAPDGPSKAASIGKLRRALGYDRLADYMPLHTSRELPAKAEVRLGNSAGVLLDSNELSFAILLEGAASCAVGEQALLELPHVREAPYRLRCKLLESVALPETNQTRLTFAHDEMPLHLRSVELRKPARGAVVLRSPLAGGAEMEPDQTAELLEASTHELFIQSLLPLVSGRLIDCSFTLGSQSFQRVRAVVHSIERAPGGEHRATLELRGLSESVRERLRRALES